MLTSDCAADRRREYKPEAITWEEVAPEAVTGKQFLLRDKAGGVTTDRSGRPVLVLRPRYTHNVRHKSTMLLDPNHSAAGQSSTNACGTHASGPPTCAAVLRRNENTKTVRCRSCPTFTMHKCCTPDAPQRR